MSKTEKDPQKLFTACVAAEKRASRATSHAWDARAKFRDRIAAEIAATIETLNREGVGPFIYTRHELRVQAGGRLAETVVVLDGLVHRQTGGKLGREAFDSSDDFAFLEGVRAFFMAWLPWADACGLQIRIHGDYFEEEK